MELTPFERVLRCPKCAKYTDPEYMGATYCEGGEVAAERLVKARKEREEAKEKKTEGVSIFLGSDVERLERCQGIDIEHLHINCECGFVWLMYTADHPEHGAVDPNWEDADDVVG